MARANAEILEDIEYQDITPDDDGPRAQDENDIGDPEDIQSRPVSKLPPAQQFRILQDWILSDIDASSQWRQQCTNDFGFVAGDQLGDEDKQLLDAQQRPHVVFNRTITILKAVAGMEINGRHEIEFLPRTNDDTAVTELMSAASKWMGDGCDAEDEESHAFQDCAKVGIGFTESRFSYEESSQGEYVEEQVDPREMVWDRAATKKNLSNARRMARVRRMPLSDAKQMFRGKTKNELDANWADMGWESGGYGPKSIEEKRIRTGENSYEDWSDSNEVTIVHIQWIEREPYYLVWDEMSGTQAELSVEQYGKLKSRMEMLGMPVDAVRLTRKCYYSGFLGNTKMLAVVKRAPCGDRFSWTAITGEFDEKKRQWFGLVRVLRDPQMWANKFLSQIMYILNSTAKGGLMAETDAFDDEREAEESYAQSDQITWMAKGAISGQKPKVMPKPGQGDPSGYVALAQFSVSALKDVTGINLELLGQQDQNQPGILEHMRKQAGMTTLATLFDSLRRYRKFVGRIRLYFIQTKMSDGRLIRVAGEEYKGLVPLLKEYTTGEYDVIVDDAPTSPNQKEANWAIMQPLLGVFKEQLMAQPEVLAQVLQYSPLPSKLVSSITRLIMQAAQDPAAQQQKDMVMKATLEKLMSETEKNKSQALLNGANAQKAGATAAYDLAVAKNMQDDQQLQTLDRLIKLHEGQSKISAARSNAELTAAKVHRERIGALTDVMGARQQAAGAATDRAVALHTLRHNRVGVLAKAHADGAKAFRDRIEGMRKAREPIPQPMAPQAGQ